MPNATQAGTSESSNRTVIGADPIAAYRRANEALATAASRYLPEHAAAANPPADVGDAPADRTTPSSSLVEQVGSAIWHAIIPPAEAKEDLPGQAVRQQNAPPSQTVRADRWNPQSGADYLNNPNNRYGGHNFTGSTSRDVCAPAVRGALSAAGIDMRGHPVDAKGYTDFLQSHGFASLGPLSDYTPQVGDVAVWQPPSDKSAGTSGHIEYYDGRNWHSDYVQDSPTKGSFATDQYGKGFSLGSKWTDVTVFRHQ